MRALQMQAIKKAGQIRAKLKLNMFEPVNIFDACETLGVVVRFVPVSMEGMYVVREDVANPDILISSLRPFARRVYTCGHELGHHVFGHGTRIDGLTDEGASKAVYDDDEYLVDTFAGALLMPVAGIEAAFKKRGWNIRNATPIQFFTIASIFGTGYRTLITHCRVNGLINDLKATGLQKKAPGEMLKELIGPNAVKSHFKIIDENAEVAVVDLETGGYIFLPENTVIEGDHLSKLKKANVGDVFIAVKPGVIRAVAGTKGFFIRIQNAGYNGLAEYRHLED
ncbi:ImmA/IrrE family metallo-endopeptidase [Mucilaginibacter sp. 21P]|uniref:ImmA/IrrE family metallo-endopeptidase n=1 Tax=Mucilaginibacter sp. 21P TaxID=2778902 RepID=UPI001C5949AD|nr:ImmA/IrrE family metallo-endopeptidase [Mucilaginibacter sp. 21P]QXV63986.1 ImmA/IrrE family metallo-endopeptidase [Mucilaginibacter sp. 21P]